jgi:hypothetical protein
MTYGLSGDAKQIIFALKSERDRLKYERDEARRDRDAFCEESLELTEERDRARAIAVELEQQNARVMELHQPVPEAWQGYDDTGNYGYIETPCGACGTDEYAVPWPCATYCAAAGEELEIAA